MSKRDATTDFQPTQFIFSLRFVQGYRFLDRCGEAFVRLENKIDEGWIPGEINPTGGRLINYTLGMTASFNTEFLTCTQSEFLDFALFCDQAITIFEILRNTFEIKHVFAPAFRIVYQIGFPDSAKADEYITNLNLCNVNETILNILGGTQDAYKFTLCTKNNSEWQGTNVEDRRRLDVSVIHQERQPQFDERILQRAELLVARQREAMNRLRELRRKHTKPSSTAAQFDIERAFESEFNSSTFNLSDFLSTSFDSIDNTRRFIEGRAK